MSAFVYNPDDEQETAQVSGDSHALRPNGTTEILPFDPNTESREKAEADGFIVCPHPALTPDVCADVIVSQLGCFGVRKTKGAVVAGVATLSEDESVVAEAEAAYLAGTFKWANAALSAHDDGAALAGLGLQRPLSPDASKARAWIKGNEGRLKTAGLIA